ncbi:MAG: hypothetical protein NWF07_07925 [Candidatus Bathyarchaeota archaeon]|nr:hypothetical protein [Candidatus Bathyarchaeota archaeon]
MSEKIRLILGLSLALLFPLLAIGVGTQGEPMIDVPENVPAWLYVEYGLVASSPERFTHVEIGEFNNLPVLKEYLREGETPINHVMVEYNGIEARRAVYYLSHVMGLDDHRHLDDVGRIFYIFGVEIDGRYTWISIVFGETRPVMC